MAATRVLRMYRRHPKGMQAGLTLVRLCTFLWGLIFAADLYAAVLPEDRADILYHQYDGGGSTIDGPSILVRKQFGEKVSIWGNYYEDVLSSASIDVVTQGSPYTENRIQQSVGADFLYDKTLMSFSYTNSDEADYFANTYAFGISQEFFGALTTLSITYSQGDDIVGVNRRSGGEIIFTSKVGEITHERFGVSVSQILTKHFILALAVESVIDEGFPVDSNGNFDPDGSVLDNPYRGVRFFLPDPTNDFIPGPGGGVGFEPERYPNTRNSDALAIRAMYYLPWRAALRLEYRAFSDSWGIEADTYIARYVQPVSDKLTLEFKYHFYDQTQASFYADTFPFINAQNFLGSDKELSTYTNNSFGVGATYEIGFGASWINKATINVFWDHLSFDYANFRDREQSSGDAPTALPGLEPLYQFDANVLRLYISLFY